MENKKHAGFISDDVGRLFKLAINKKAIENGLEEAAVNHGWIIGYLHFMEEKGKAVCQKDLEDVFHMPKSTAADMMSLMEKKGYIKRVAVEGDARKKQVLVTEAGNVFLREIEDTIDEVEDIAKRNISEDDIATCFSVLEKMRINLMEISPCLNRFCEKEEE